jgi:hypothetical protein
MFPALSYAMFFLGLEGSEGLLHVEERFCKTWSHLDYEDEKKFIHFQNCLSRAMEDPWDNLTGTIADADN